MIEIAFILNPLNLIIPSTNRLQNVVYSLISILKCLLQNVLLQFIFLLRNVLLPTATFCNKPW